MVLILKLENDLLQSYQKEEENDKGSQTRRKIEVQEQDRLG